MQLSYAHDKYTIAHENITEMQILTCHEVILGIWYCIIDISMMPGAFINGKLNRAKICTKALLKGLVKSHTIHFLPDKILLETLAAYIQPLLCICMPKG